MYIGFGVLILSLLISLPFSFAASVTYTYDSLNRVTSVDYGAGATEDFTYDAAGNRTTMIVTVTDTDGDTVGDYMDNCYLTPNLGQQDTDGDGYGNMCDADLNNDGIVSIVDYNAFRNAWGLNSSSPTWNPDIDFNSDGVITIVDYNTFRNRWNTSQPYY